MSIPGLSWRDATDEARRTPAAPLNQRLDDLPLPEYDDFVEQLAASEWGHDPPRIFFETSRGCWWGQKHLCTFCGLNGEGLPFRRKSPARAVHEIRTLHERYETAEALYAVDNILDMAYFEGVFPHLVDLASDPKRPLRMFYEIKTNLRRDQVRAMAAGGIWGVNPGIESFSDDLLAMMKKGSSCLQNVQLLKWLRENDIWVAYSLMLRNPNDTLSWYDEVEEILPYLVHLPAPSVNFLALERFSPYFMTPEQFGIEKVRPQRYYQLMFRSPRIDQAEIAYMFDYEHAAFEDESILAAHRRLGDLIIQWAYDYRAGRDAFHRVEDDHIYIEDGRMQPMAGVWRRGYRLTNLGIEMLLTLDSVRTLRSLRRHLPAAEPEVVDAALDTFQHRRWGVSRPAWSLRGCPAGVARARTRIGVRRGSRPGPGVGAPPR